MSASPSSSLVLSASSPTVRKWPRSARSTSNLLVHFRRSFPIVLASSGNASSSVGTAMSTEMDAVSSFSEIVPDTVIFDDFEKFPPTAATVSSSLLLGICSLPDTKFKNAVETALANSECYEQGKSSDRMSCFLNKALVNVGADLARLVPGNLKFKRRGSRGPAARLEARGSGQGWKAKGGGGVESAGWRLASADGRVWRRGGVAVEVGRLGVIGLGRRDGLRWGKTVGGGNGVWEELEKGGGVHELLRLYNEVEVSSERLLFKIPSTWQGIEASRLLEAEGIQTHLTFVYSFPQAAAAAQAGASVIQIFVGRIRDWARNHSGDPEIEAACKGGQDPGLALPIKAYNYIHKYGHKSKLMAAAIRNKQDLFGLLGVDYIIAPLKILQSLKESVTYPDEKYSYVRRLTLSSAKEYEFSDEELLKWDQRSLAAAMGPCAEELLASGLDGYINQTKRVEELFGKIWPPPNV
ncbi:transaldolase [Dendrobium catenatum]|uniref:Transaldolase n=1 Tax=Dendrobium catenatum TaxID=906689 RepID=A0A2I0XE03_9ASPA|nr:transaldolase [Dendrobium catenatum]